MLDETIPAKRPIARKPTATIRAYSSQKGAEIIPLAPEVPVADEIISFNR